MKHNHRDGTVKRDERFIDVHWVVKGFDDELDVVAIACPWGCPQYSGKGRQRGRHGAKHFVHSRVRFKQKMTLHKLINTVPEETD